MIVKIQIPLMSSEENAEALVYNQTRSFQAHMPIDDTIKKFMNGEYKKFARISYHLVSKKVEIQKELGDQGW